MANYERAANDNGDENETWGWVILGATLGAICMILVGGAFIRDHIASSFINSLVNLGGIG